MSIRVGEASSRFITDLDVARHGDIKLDDYLDDGGKADAIVTENLRHSSSAPSHPTGCCEERSVSSATGQRSDLERVRVFCQATRGELSAPEGVCDLLPLGDTRSPRGI